MPVPQIRQLLVPGMTPAGVVIEATTRRSCRGALAGTQSLSLLLSQPGAQHESPFAQAVIGVVAHAALQFAELPISVPAEQIGAGQATGQDSGGSHVSLPSTVPLPQVVEQSLSVLGEQPAGQQPSPPSQAVTARQASVPPSVCFAVSLPQPTARIPRRTHLIYG